MNSYLDKQVCIQPKGFYYKYFLVMCIEKTEAYTSKEDKISRVHQFGFY